MDRSEEVLAAAGREERAEPLEDAGVQRLLPVEHVDRVLVGHHDQAPRAERDDRTAVHARDERVFGVELEGGTDRGDALVVEHPLEPRPGPDVGPPQLSRDDEALHAGPHERVDLVPADRGTAVRLLGRGAAGVPLDGLEDEGQGAAVGLAGSSHADAVAGGVPEDVARLRQLVDDVLVGLLVEGVDDLHGVVTALGVDVAQARVEAGRLGPKNHHRLGGLIELREHVARGLVECVLLGDEVVRGSDERRDVAVLVGQRRDAQRERCRGPGRVLLEDQVLRRHRAEGRPGGVGEAGARRDVDPARVDDLAEPLDGAREQRPVADDGLELLGGTVAADRPQARALAAGEDDGDGRVRSVGHGTIPSQEGAARFTVAATGAA